MSRIGSRRWRIAALLSAGVLVNYIDRVNLSVSHDALQGSFGISDFAFGWLLSAYNFSIRGLVVSGAVVAGAKPNDDPSLADDQHEFEQLASELFGDGAGVHKVGKGTVYAAQSLKEVLTALQAKPDFDYVQHGTGSTVEFAHRKLDSADIYFVDNRNDHETSIDATFRVAGRQPELWRAETASTQPVSFTIANGRTTLPLHLEPWGTVFVVFRKATSETVFKVPESIQTTVMTLTGSWTVAFQPGRGAPASITMTQLSDWSTSEDVGVKYFSGIATYRKTVEAASEWFRRGSRVWLDLGDVKNLAEVSVNGKDLGQTWHAPYRVDVTAALKAGSNEITVKVVNAWVNRMIGDEQPGATKITFADVKPYRSNSPLLPSGLLGPVNILREDTR